MTSVFFAGSAQWESRVTRYSMSSHRAGMQVETSVPGTTGTLAPLGEVAQDCWLPEPEGTPTKEAELLLPAEPEDEPGAGRAPPEFEGAPAAQGPEVGAGSLGL